MSLPSPLLTVPTLTADSLYFQGPSGSVQLGPGTPFLLKEIDGLDLPSVRSGNTSRAQTRGSFAGVNLLDTRQITLTFDVGPFVAGYGSYGSLAGALAALRTATSTAGVTEYPLWLRLPGGSQWCAMARCTKRAVKWDLTADLGGLVQGASLQFEATDPYLYASPTLAPSVGLAAPSQGLTFSTSGVAVPETFGGSGTPNQITALNTGDVPCFPLLVITGPCTNPSITNLSIPGVPQLQFSVSMNAGDTMIVDCDAQTVTYFSAGSSVGASRLNALMPGSSWFSILPGASTTLTFNSADATAVTGTLTAYWTSVIDALM